jgi:hypothetical protein
MRSDGTEEKSSDKEETYRKEYIVFHIEICQSNSGWIEPPRLPTHTQSPKSERMLSKKSLT